MQYKAKSVSRSGNNFESFHLKLLSIVSKRHSCKFSHDCINVTYYYCDTLLTSNKEMWIFSPTKESNYEKRPKKLPPFRNYSVQTFSNFFFISSSHSIDTRPTCKTTVDEKIDAKNAVRMWSTDNWLDSIQTW